MKKVDVKIANLAKYSEHLENKDKAHFENLSKELHGLRVAFINSTSFGGGVSELFYSIIPLLKSSGINIHWYTIDGDDRFFNITKKPHNMFQGKDAIISNN